MFVLMRGIELLGAYEDEGIAGQLADHLTNDHQETHAIEVGHNVGLAKMREGFLPWHIALAKAAQSHVGRLIIRPSIPFANGVSVVFDKTTHPVALVWARSAQDAYVIALELGMPRVPGVNWKTKEHYDVPDSIPPF